MKKGLLRLFFTAEIIIFSWFYYYGSRGVCSVQGLDQENCQLTQNIAELKQEIEEVDYQIIAWNSDPYFKEKIAREQLQMAYSFDEIYLT